MASGQPEELQELLKEYLNPDSDNFLQLDPVKIMKNIAADARQSPVTLEMVELFRRSLEYQSKIKDQHILRVSTKYGVHCVTC